METLKKILLFLGVLLALFMMVGMWYGAMLFFFVLKLMVYAGVIGGLIFLYFKYRK